MTDTTIWTKAGDPESASAKWRGFEPGTTILSAGSIHAHGGLPLPCDIVLDRDVEVTLRDGTIIYADVFRPVTDAALPTVLAWSPYGKQGGYWHLDVFPGRVGVPESAVSGLQKWEGPDPAYWCAHGYAVVHPDARGAFESGGDIQSFSRQEGRDGADVIEWIADQAWSNQKVAMAGNSWLAASQWIIAGERPPHLSAIAPWEGFSDIYRDFVSPGGIPAPDFLGQLMSHHYGRNRYEDLSAMLAKYPLVDEYWSDKVFDTSGIEIPVYVVASYTNGVHVRGTFRAWHSLGSRQRWLRIHNTQEWPDFYAHQEDLRRFFDHVLKGEDNGWEATPRVRMAILDPGHEDVVDVPVDEFPPSPAVVTRFDLDAEALSIVAGKTIEQEGVVSYDAKTGSAVFTGDLGDLTLAGPMKLRLWVKSDGHPEMDLFVGISKLGIDGEQLAPETSPGVPTPGARGWLRVSQRALDEGRSTDLVPYQRHDRREPLTAGEVMPVDIEIWPMAMRWHAGEKVRIEIAGHDLYKGANDRPSGDNAGRHILHTGGRYAAYLLAPVLPE